LATPIEIRWWSHKALKKGPGKQIESSFHCFCACPDITTDRVGRVLLMTGRKPLPTRLKLAKSTARLHGTNREKRALHPNVPVATRHGVMPEFTSETGDRWLADIAKLEPGDRWTDPTVWIKANLAVAANAEDLRRQVDEAREMLLQQNAICRFRLNEWTEQILAWTEWGSFRGIPIAIGNPPAGLSAFKFETPILSSCQSVRCVVTGSCTPVIGLHAMSGVTLVG
jgi:hypothetical protein